MCEFDFRVDFKSDKPPFREKNACYAVERCWEINHAHWPWRDFDSTLGFPGEGPIEPMNWSLLSYNVGSLNTNVEWKTVNDNVVCLQETRIGRNNAKTSAAMVQTTGRKLFTGEKLPGIISQKGFSRTPHGGTAILAPEELTIPFSPSDDSSQLYEKVYASKRVNAIWVQVRPRVKMLIFSFYGQSGASTEKSAFDFNCDLLSDIFTICSQFGDIPIAITGDFQTVPQHYKPVHHAMHFCGWHDPLLVTDELGEWTRPMTFSRDGAFSGGDFCTSIDAILVNKVAFAALSSVEVLEWNGTQHRPIRAVFSWEVLFQHGHTHNKHAALCLDNLCDPQQRENVAEQLWETEFERSFHGSENIDGKWEIANRFCLDVLLKCGATWLPGKQTRTAAPSFKPKQFCPGQAPTYVATNLNLSKQRNTLAKLLELRVRIERYAGSSVDVVMTQRLARKTWRALRDLKAPQLWNIPHFPDLPSVVACQEWLKDTLTQSEKASKLKRIQKWKISMQLSSLSDKAFVFKHLRNKAKEEPSNLVADREGNIIYQPCLAIKELNDQWDTVFAANVLHEDPMKVLEIVWPQIHNVNVQCEEIPLTPEILHSTVQSRAPLAAPGLDGWRTTEVQALPVKAMLPICQCFAMIENTTCHMPAALSTAKQMILNKSGKSTPLNKRLITLLPVFLLAYTGSRFKQLQKWQEQIMPPQIYGAIQGRKMSAVHTGLRLAIDDANAEQKPLVGIKLDKSKCFDRIVPKIAAMLFLTFGIPQTIVSFFIKMYDGLKRFMSYRGWMSLQYTTAANGVAQGCSMSLIAINVYNLVLCHLVKSLPTVTLKAFIDDAYLWAHLSNVHDLQTVMKISDVWDKLSGQLLNDEKCVTWGTNADARHQIMELFPKMTFQYVFDCLGAIIYTAANCPYSFPQEKISKICTDAKNIAMLPFPMTTRMDLAASKVIPQCTFASNISMIPRRDIGKIQNEIANVCWFQKPHWRSKWLIFALLVKPHRVEPIAARAYTAIVDFCRTFQNDSQLQKLILKHAKLDLPKTALISSVQEAFGYFGLRLTSELAVVFDNHTLCSFKQLTLKDVKTVLPYLARQACYLEASKKKRKDFHEPSGIIDHQLSTVFSRQKQNDQPTIPDNSFFESQLVGCTLTRDRLIHAKLVDTSSCRFCHEAKEDIPHLLRCPQVIQILGQTPEHELGANFYNLGIVEHPKDVLINRLKLSDLADIHVAEFDACANPVQRWTDGSLVCANFFWLACGSFAIVDETGFCIKRGIVRAWCMSSYTTELWALLEAICGASAPVTIYTDCQTIVRQFNSMKTKGHIDPDWLHYPWWEKIHTIWRERSNDHTEPIILQWIPSHVLEHVPIHLITEEMAEAKQTSIVHIQNNRVADFAARDVAQKHAVIRPGFMDELLSHILERQTWLQRLNKCIAVEYQTNTQTTAEETTEQDADKLTIDIARKIFPQWPWDASPSNYQWKAKIHVDLAAPKNWHLTECDWCTFCSFLRKARWKCSPNAETAYIEMTVLFILRGFSFENIDKQLCTYKQMNGHIRRGMTMLSRLDGVSPFPGTMTSTKAKNSGRTLPTGTLVGAEILWTPAELTSFAKLLQGGAGAKIASWHFPLD